MDLKKLRDMEIAPSERANELFRSRMEQLHPSKQKTPRGRYFATAAAVILVFGLLFVVRFNQDNTAAVLPDPVQTSASKPEAPASETPEPGTPQPGTPQPGTPQPGAPQPGVLQQEIKTEPVAPGNRFPEKSTPAVHLAHAAQQPVSAVHQAAEPPAMNLEYLSPQVNYYHHEVELTDFAVLDVDREIELETGPATLAASAPLPLLARVVREVKYVMNGDKPDLDRAGIKPAATALAYNPNGLLAHESRQVKQGIDRFKEMFKTE